MAKSKHRLDARRFLRAALKRHEEAGFLLEAGFTTASVYLGGYAVECALKALILSNEPVQRNAATLSSFRGAVAHDFYWLRRCLGQRKVIVPDAVAPPLARLVWWTTELRYESAEVGEERARNFRSSSDEVLAWVERSI
jgi:hypothetical protein